MQAKLSRYGTSYRIVYNLLVLFCRFKRQISDKPQCEGSEAPTKPQYIEQYAKNSPVFGVEIKYRAVSIYSFSKNTAMFSAFSFLVYLRQSRVLRENRLMDLVMTMSIFPASQSAIMRLNSSRLRVFVPDIPSSA